MGYYSRVDGRIEITPPLNAAEVRELGLATKSNESLRSSVRIEMETEERDTDEGTLTILRGTALVAARDGASKYYTLDEDIQAAVTKLPGRTFTGALIRAGEEQGDVERYRIENGRVVTEKASLRWADGTEVDL